MITIESTANPRFRRWRELLAASGVRNQERALLPGRKLIDELVARDPARVHEVLLGPKHEPLDADVPHVRLGGELFRALDVVGTRQPLAVIGAPAPPRWTPAPPRGLELILALSDPGNLGACLRSAEAFGVTCVILTEECSSPYLPRALKASAGSALRLAMSRAGQLAGMNLDGVIGLDRRGEPLGGFAWPRDARLALGEEGRGLPPEWRGPRLAIPMAPAVESLNATVAASIALYSYALGGS